MISVFYPCWEASEQWFVFQVSWKQKNQLATQPNQFLLSSLFFEVHDFYCKHLPCLLTFRLNLSYPTISSKGHIQIASWSLYRKRLLSCAASLCEFLGSIIFWWALFSNSEINLRWLYWWGRWLKLLTLVLSVSPPLKADPTHLKNRSETSGVAQAA